MGGAQQRDQQEPASRPAEGGSGEGPLDTRITASLRQMAARSTAGAEGIRHLVTTYLTGSDERAHDLRRAVDERDLGTAAQVAHSLAGSSASIGARELAEACRCIESAVCAEDVSSLPELLRLMERSLTETRTSLVTELLGDR